MSNFQTETIGVTVMKMAKKMTACALVIVLLFGLFTGCSRSDDVGAGAWNEVPDNGVSEVESKVGTVADTAVEPGPLAKSAVANPTSTIAVGGDQSFAIRDDGCLLAWNNSVFLTVGGNPPQVRFKPLAIMENVVSISTGKHYTMAIRDDGSLWVWDNDGFDQTGDSSITDLATPERIMDDVSSVSVGDAHAFAIRSDGSLWAWGDNEFGQLGDGTTTSRQAPVKIMDNIAAVSAGQRHTMAIGEDGSLWAWGSNTHGQLGDNARTSRLEPVKIMENVFAVSAGNTHTMAIHTDGSLWAWGENNFGQLGDGTTKDRFAPVKILEDVIAVSAGAYHTMAIRTDDSLWVWGIDEYGSIGMDSGNPGSNYSKTPEPLKIMGGITVVSAGNYYSMASGADGGLWVLGGSRLHKPDWSIQVNWGYTSDVTANVMSPPREFPSEWRPSSPEPFPGKIALVTIVNRGAYDYNEDYRSVMALLNKYGVDKIAHRNWPLVYPIEIEKGVAILEEIAADPDVKALVIAPLVRGIGDAVDRFREIRDDVFVVYVNAREHPPEAAARANLILSTNYLLMGESIVLQSKALGAKTFVHWATEYHLKVPELAAKRDIMKSTCESQSIEYIELYAPYGSGVADIEIFILQRMWELVENLGRDTAFYGMICAMQWPLIRQVIETGAIYPQPCCPSPYHGFESVLNRDYSAYLVETYGVDSTFYRSLDLREIIETTRILVDGKGVSGRISNWPVSEYVIWLNAGVEYAIKWINGEVPEDTIDYDALSSICAAYTKEAVGEEFGATFEPFAHNGRVYRHWVMGLMDYLVY